MEEELDQQEPLEQDEEDAVLEAEYLDENPPEAKAGSRQAALSPKQHKALRMLLNGKGNTEVADELGVHVDTVLNWRRSRTFAKIYRKEINAATKVAMSILQANASHAAQTLVQMIDNKEFTKGQYNACKSVLDYSLQFASLEELQKEVEELKNRSTRII